VDIRKRKEKERERIYKAQDPTVGMECRVINVKIK